jgi:hypothetical protein
MKSAVKLSRPTLSDALSAWKKNLADCGYSTDLLWIFEENLCIEPLKIEKGGFHFGYQTKFSSIHADALEIAYDQFCLTNAPIVFYRLGSRPDQSVCILLSDPWFKNKTEGDGFIRQIDSGIYFFPGEDEHIEEVTELSRWVRRVKRNRTLQVLDFCLSLESIDEIIVYGRQLLPYERVTSRMVNRLRRILGQD